MGKQLIINFFKKDLHIQKEPIDYNQLYELSESGICSAKTLDLTPKNREKIEKKLIYLDSLDLLTPDIYHKIDDYSINLLRIKYGLLPKLKNKMIYDNRVYKFIFEYYYNKHNINFDEFVAIDTDPNLLAAEIDLNIDLVLEKQTKTLEELSYNYKCTRESIRLRIIEAKKFINARFKLPTFDYVLDQNFDKLTHDEKLVLLASDLHRYDKFNAYILNEQIKNKVLRFEEEIENLKKNYAYPSFSIDSPLRPLVENYVENDKNLYIVEDKIYSLVKSGEHHNANFILNYLKHEELESFFIEDLLADNFTSSIHGKLLANNISISLRNLEAILDREPVLVKIDTHHYQIESTIDNIEYLIFSKIEKTISAAPNVVTLELLEELFHREIKMLNISVKGFYYIIKKHLFDKFTFRKLVIYNSEYKLQTKFELLAKDFDKQKIITLDAASLTNATNLSRKFKNKGGIIYGDKLYNTNLLRLSKKLLAIDITPDFDEVIYRSTFNKAIDHIVLDEIDFKRKFAFKLWCFLHNYEYFNFYARYDSKYPELHTLVYAINGKQKKIGYTKFIDTIEDISGSRKVYQILHNMIENDIVLCSADKNKIITFKEENLKPGPQKTSPKYPNSLEVYNKMENLTLAELRQIAKKAYLVNINKYNKKELISILRNTVKVKEIF